MKQYLAALFPGLLLSGCASVPDVEYSYNWVKSASVVTVTQSIACNNDKTALVVVNAPAVTSSYAADLTKPPFRFKIKDIDGAFGPWADTDMSFTYYDDGRLKTINQSSTGQGETAIKAAVSLATTLGAVGGGAAQPAAKAVLPACATIATWGGGKPVTLTYGAPINIESATGKPQVIPVSPGSAALANAIGGGPGVTKLSFLVSKPVQTGSGAHWAAAANTLDAGVVNLPLQKTASVRVEVQDDKGRDIFDGNLVLPDDGLGIALPGDGTYTLPIPKAALFGKQNFSLTLAESGAIMAVDYGKNTGATGALNAAGSIAATQTPTTTAAQAADEKAKADLIYQNKRYAACLATPASCTSN